MSDSMVRAWYMVAPPPPTPEPACLGPHVHQPPPKKSKTLNFEDFKGYSLLHAAGDGCAHCVEYWLAQGVDANFESSSCGHTAMDFVLWADKRSSISATSAKQVSEMLAAAGGQAKSV